MNKNIISTFALSVFLMMGVSAHAAYQSQTMLRIWGPGTGGLIQTLPAVTASEFNIFIPGVKVPQKITDAALLYDKRNPLPGMTQMGGNYAFFTGGLMATVTENGSLYYKGKVNVDPAVLGGNYFLNKNTNEVIAIDSAGFYNFTGVIGNDLRLVGGNFYIDQAGTLTTIKHMGTAPGNPLGMITVKEGYSFCDAIRAGGNFFVNVDGTVVGINSENGFFTDHQKVDSRPNNLGGNYFISEDNTLYTVSSLGEVKKQMPIIGKMKYFGYSYMVDADGDFIFVDGKGVPHTEMVRVSTTGIKSAVLKTIKDKLEIHKSFIAPEQDY